MRGQDEDLGGAEGSPFHLAGEHAGPRDAVGNAKSGGLGLEGGAPAFHIGAGHDQVPCGIAREASGEGVEQQIAAFLRMESAHVEGDAGLGESGRRRGRLAAASG